MGKILFAMIFGVTLSKEESYGDVKSVNGEDDGGLGSVIDSANGG